MSLEKGGSADNLSLCLQGFKGDGQHLELLPERNWMPLQLMQQANLLCVLLHSGQLKFRSGFQGKPLVECIGLIQTGSDQGTSRLWARPPSPRKGANNVLDEPLQSPPTTIAAICHSSRSHEFRRTPKLGTSSVWENVTWSRMKYYLSLWGKKHIAILA